MDSSKGAAAAIPTQVYEDLVPPSKLVQEEHLDILHINLPGFKKEQLRIQLTVTRILKISGQRPIGQNKWQRFQNEIPVSENCDRSKISATFENGILYVKQPKLMISAVKRDKESPVTEAENAHAKRQKTTLRDEFSTHDYPENNSGKEPEKKAPKNTSPKTTEQKEATSLSQKSPVENTSTSSIVEDRKESSSSSESESESTEDETDDDTTGNGNGYANGLAANLKMPRKVMKMTLAAMLALGIGVYLANVLKSANEAEEFFL